MFTFSPRKRTKGPRNLPHALLVRGGARIWPEPELQTLTLAPTEGPGSCRSCRSMCVLGCTGAWVLSPPRHPCPGTA